MTPAQYEALIRRQAAEIGQLRAEVKRLSAENAVLRAERDEARAALAELRVQHADLKRNVSQLLVAIETGDERLMRLIRREFGATSERACADQTVIAECAHLLPQALDDDDTDSTSESTDTQDRTSTQAKTSNRRRPAKAGGRLPLPQDIERRHITYTPPEDHPFLRGVTASAQVGTATIERWSVGKVDLHIEVVTCPILNLTLANGIVTRQTMTPPSVIERGQVSDELLVQSAVDKVVDHLPSHRQELRAERLGVLIPRSKLCRWHIALATFLVEIAKAIFTEICACPSIGIDDTIHRLQVDDRRVCQNGRLWAVSSPVGCYYLFSTTREGQWISDLLGGYHGAVMGDAYSGHNDLLSSPDIVAVFCWAHVRRKFFESNHPKQRQVMLDLIQKLYAIEAGLRDVDPAERVFIRSAQAKPILASIKAHLDAWMADPGILPTSGLGRAVRYTLKLWPGLERYCTIGSAPIDNNATERAIRPIALHRKNSLFSASVAGAEAYATLLTLTQTALIHDLDPVAYLNDIIEDMHYARRPVSELTPSAYARRREAMGKQAP